MTVNGTCIQCLKEHNRQWREQNPNKMTECRRRWEEKNPDKRRATVQLRRARKMKACPPWVDRAAIKAIYAECQRISEETGIKHEVDHVIPLKNAKVCGLHLAINLRVVPAAVNHQKGNRFLEECSP